MTQTVTLHFDAEPMLIRVVRKQAAAAATALGATEQRAGSIELAVGEALSNAYVHGYGRASGPIELEIAYEGHTFGITIHDTGRGLPTFPASLNPRDGGRWGLQVIHELMDDAVLCPGPSGVGTTVRMSIRLSGETEEISNAHRFRREPWWQ